MTRRTLFLSLAGLAPAAAAQPRFGRPQASAAKVEVKGKIERVQIVPGQGMPFLEVRDREGLHRVYLGSMRYLIEKDFKPAAGELAIVRGFKASDGILAIRVEIPAAKSSIDLRDENCEPRWRRGRWGRR